MGDCLEMDRDRERQRERETERETERQRQRGREIAAQIKRLKFVNPILSWFEIESQRHSDAIGHIGATRKQIILFETEICGKETTDGGYVMLFNRFAPRASALALMGGTSMLREDLRQDHPDRNLTASHATHPPLHHRRHQR
jgi:hypothetical protein